MSMYQYPTPYRDLARTRYLPLPTRLSARPPDRPPDRLPAPPDAMGENNTPKLFQAVGYKAKEKVKYPPIPNNSRPISLPTGDLPQVWVKLRGQ